MKFGADSLHLKTQNTYGMDHAGSKIRIPARLVQHDAAQGMHLFLILPEKFDDATPHDAAVGVTVPARASPSISTWSPSISKETSGRVCRISSFLPSRAQWKNRFREPSRSS